MKTEWIKHRKLVAAYYRSANAYAALCRRQNLSSEGLNPTEVQIIEHIIEHSDENNNMKWYAQRLGISTSAFTNYVRGLEKKKLVEKYHTTDNKKNIILKITERGMAAYDEYAEVMNPIFAPIFEIIDRLPEEQQECVTEMLEKWADQHCIGTQEDTQFSLVPVNKG